MRYRKFEDLPIWQTAHRLGKQLNRIMARGSFRRDWSLRDQLKRATTSMMGNVAEGFSRRSDKEFAQFLFIAKASAAESQSHLYAALGRSCITSKEFQTLYGEIESFCRQASGLIKFLTGHAKRRTAVKAPPSKTL